MRRKDEKPKTVLEGWEIVKDGIETISKRLVNRTKMIMRDREPIDVDDLINESYVYYVDLYEKYDPYYNPENLPDYFVPFDKYIYRNIIQKLQYYISKYYGRELLPFGKDLTEIMSMDNFDDISSPENFATEVHSKVKEYYLKVEHSRFDFEERLLVYETARTVLSEREYNIFLSIVSGIPLKDIARKYGLNPSRISHIKKQIVRKLRYTILEKEMEEQWEDRLIDLLSEATNKIGHEVWLGKTKNGTITLQSKKGTVMKFEGISLEDAIIGLEQYLHDS